MNTQSDPRLMIPMIRKTMPQIVANQIMGVQPMTGTGGKSLFRQFFDKQFNKKYWPYQYEVDHHDRFEIERWCWDRFKGRYWNNYGHKFVFKREKDAVLFALRWI